MNTFLIKNGNENICTSSTFTPIIIKDLTLIGMRQGGFTSLYFLNWILSAEFLILDPYLFHKKLIS